MRNFIQETILVIRIIYTGGISMSDNNNSNTSTDNSSTSAKTNTTKIKSTLLTDGKNMNVLAAAVANIIAENYTNAEVEIISQFFQILSDLLDNITTVNILSGRLNTTPIIETTQQREILR